MLMVELIYILLSISAENSDLVVPASLMSAVATQMFRLRTLHHARASTMRARMVSLWQGGWNDQVQALDLSKVIDGMILSLHRIETTFLSLFWNMTHELFVPALPSSQSLPIGDFAKIQSRTNIHRHWLLIYEDFLSLRDGHCHHFNVTVNVSNHPGDSLSREPQLFIYREGCCMG
jgi:hypothetical protein